MIRHVILHIGQSKTGTSSLQAFLARNRAALVRRGILYPDILKHGAPVGALNHNSIAEALIGSIRYPGLSAEQYFDQFSKQCQRNRCETLLLSGESFFSVPQVWRLPVGADYLAHYRTKLNVLKELLGSATCTAVVYLRPQDDWLESAIGQIIRYEGLLGRRVYENDEQILALLSPHLDYATLLDLWDEVVRPEKLIAIPYERKRLYDQDVVHDFVTRLSLPISGQIETGGEEHISLDRSYLWLKNVLNRIDRSKDEERVIIDRLTVLNKRQPVRRKWGVAEALKAACRRQFAASNERLAQRLGIAPEPFFTSWAPDPSGPAAAASEATRHIKAEPELEDGLAALLAFEQLYFSPATRWVRARTRLVSKLRYDYPRLHTAAKRLATLIR
jgi:hypothetical protein